VRRATLTWSLAVRCAVLALAGGVVSMLAPAAAQAADPAGTIYVADYASSAIDVFAPGASGNVAPLRRIVGAETGLDGPADVAVDSAGDVYSSNFNDGTITEYAPGASGNVAPIRTIAGELTRLGNNDDISVATNGTIYVGNFSASPPVVVFAPGASGNVAPIRTLEGAETGLGSVDGLGVDATGTLYVDSGGSIRVFAPGASGNVAPVRVIEGSNTNLNSPDDVKVGFSGQLFVSDFGNNSLQVFEPGASGNATPTRNIEGGATELTSVDDLAVTPEGGMYVTNFFTPNVVEFGPTANGNVAPIAKIAGAETTFGEPEGVALATPAAEATLSTTDSAPALRVGESTHDTATLEGGRTPTGQLIFKLYGPSDPTCSKAPAFTSGLIEVNGDGSYEGPAFGPTEAGKYSWVVEYSGDPANAAKATNCEEIGEQVTVEEGAGPPECSRVIGTGHWGARGPEGGNLDDKLSTTLTEKQELATTGPNREFHMHLAHLASASCVAVPGGFEFSGTGTAKFNHEGGYTIAFSLEVAGGHTFYTLILEKEGVVVYTLLGQQLRRDGTEHIT